MIELTYTIDWYSVTLEPDNAGYVQRVVVLGDRIPKATRKPQFGYDEIAMYEGGAVLMWSSTRKDMGAHLVMSGGALRYADQHGQSCEQILSECNRLGGRCSRIDLAIDVYGSGWTLADLSKKKLLPYAGRGRTPKYLPVGTDEDGFTIYVGSRQSEKFLRIYDKAKEMGDFNSDIKRIEIECKGMTAHWLGSELADKDTREIYDTCSSLVKTMANYENSSWVEALSSQEVTLAIPKKQGKDTLGWLVRSCAPALARAIAEKPNDDVIGEFMTALKNHLSEYNLDVE